MARPRKYRDFGDWYREKSLIFEIDIGKDEKFSFFDNRHFDNDTDRIFWHGITIHRISKSRSGRWVYREKLNVPYKKFSDFCEAMNDVDLLRRKRKKQTPNTQPKKMG
jgi:hypothetical protein